MQSDSDGEAPEKGERGNICGSQVSVTTCRLYVGFCKLGGTDYVYNLN